MKVALHAGSLTIRGTAVAIYDYALGLRTLGHEPIILYNRTGAGNDPAVIQRFRNSFPLHAYDAFSDVDTIVEKHNIDATYFLKAGPKDGQLTRSTRNLVHAVFPTPWAEAHGHVFAFISRWLANYCTNGKLPWVPHAVSLPDVAGDLRGELAIAADHLVLGGYGGYDSFDIPFVHRTLAAVLQRRRDLSLVFMNTRPFIEHERVRFLPASADPQYKVRFIQTCDAMIHARALGESFGIACGEFSIKNRRVITFGFSPQRAHIQMLGDAALVYTGERSLRRILLGLDRAELHRGQWDRYSRAYSLESVMKRFAEVFLSDEVSTPQPSPGDKCLITARRLRKRIADRYRRHLLWESPRAGGQSPRDPR